MEIIDLIVEEEKNIRGVKLTLKTDQGEIFVFKAKKGIARRLMRAIFLRIGIDPRYTGNEEIAMTPEEKEERMKELK